MNAPVEAGPDGGYLIPYEMSEAIIDMPAFHLRREAIVGVIRWKWLGAWINRRTWNRKRTDRNFWRRMANVREVAE